MDVQEYTRYDAIGLRELISTRQVSTAEVEKAARSALAAADEEVNALVGPMFPVALQHAGDGPFTGIPFLIKDVPMAEGVPFQLGSSGLRGIVARRDTDLMARFRTAGMATLGVTTMPELGLNFATESLANGPTRNPWDTDRGVGGSSGGAAALVAARAVPIAHAIDGAGSIRIPASCCGLVGLKPSRGRITGGPDTGESAFGMSYGFALTRTVRDTAHLLDAVQGPGIGDKYAAATPRRRYADELHTPPPPLRVAVTTQSWSGSVVDPEVALASLEVARTLEKSGHVVSESNPAVDWDAVIHTMLIQAAAIAEPLLRAPRQPDPAKLEAVTRRLLTEVKAMSAMDLMSGFDTQNHITRSVAAFFARYDLLITPTLAQLPALHGTLNYNNPAHTVTSWLRHLFDYGPFTAVFNISGQPAISLPLGHSTAGLPIGVQIIAPTGRDDLLISIAAQLETAMPWNHRLPAGTTANCR